MLGLLLIVAIVSVGVLVYLDDITEDEYDDY